MKTVIRRPVILALTIAVAALAGLYILTIDQPKPLDNVSLEQRQKEFVQYVDTAQLQNKTLVFESSDPLCASSNTVDHTDCTLSKTFIYKLDGNYRDNGKEVFDHLKRKGFDFRKGDEYKDEVEKKLKNSTLADNLSNSEPIIVDIYNIQNNIRVRVNLGDLGRTLPYASGQLLDQLSDEQLIVGLQFFNP